MIPLIDQLTERKRTTWRELGSKAQVSETKNTHGSAQPILA